MCGENEVEIEQLDGLTEFGMEMDVAEGKDRDVETHTRTHATSFNIQSKYVHMESMNALGLILNFVVGDCGPLCGCALARQHNYISQIGSFVPDGKMLSKR